MVLFTNRNPCGPNEGKIMGNEYGMTIQTLDGAGAVGTVDNRTAVMFAGAVTQPVAGLQTGQSFRLDVFAANDDSPLDVARPLGVLASANGPTTDTHRFMVAIRPPAVNGSVALFAMELLARAGASIVKKGLVGPSVLVAFEHDGCLILAESWPDRMAHRVFVERVLLNVAVDMGIDLSELNPVEIDDSTVVANGAHGYVVGA